MLTARSPHVDAVDTSAGYEAILLGYARCNDGVAGVTARQVPLVIPRAHDCITFFFGSRETYKKYFDRYPGTYYMTTGWAKQHGWRFEVRDGDLTLLEKLFFGKWDEDFVIVPPGKSIVARNDEWVLDVSN